MGFVFVLILLIIISIPYIICSVLAVGIIEIINTKGIKSKVIKILMIIIILSCICILLFNFKEERPDNLCTEMNEINDNQSLIGMSKEHLI